MIGLLRYSVCKVVIILLYSVGLQYQPVQQQYGFHVQNDNMGERTAPPEFVMPFNRIILDFGGAWDSFTNMFVVPVKGVYAFHLNIQKTGVTDDDLYVHIMKDAIRVSAAHVNGPNAYGTGCTMALIELDLLHNVYAQVTHGPIRAVDYRGVGSIQFTGYLLYNLS